MSSASGADGPLPPLGNEIAIVGMAGRFPGARTVAEFWANIRAGVESIRRLSDEELIAAGASRSELEDPAYVKACPVLSDVDKFDARFFGLSPRDASVMDPAHRFFLEVAWEAFEHAGYTALPEEGAVGVFAGSGAPLYLIENLWTNPELMRSMGDFLIRHTGNDMNFLATRVSYEMDLRGPSINVQTACSSALVALHLACQSLLRGECTLALAGGSTVLIPHGRGYLYKEGEIASRDGHCRPFDAHSTGTVFGSGTGCVVLKRLQDALDDGDTIHAIVKGSAINNDGAVKVGYLAPGVDGQAAVIARALEVAGVPADSISYVETHGTGTLVGDPIEVEALNQAFRAKTEQRRFCGIGSVKSNIGHLGEAAAAASLIKAIMALKQRELPPSLGFERPNPAIDFDDSPFYVNATLRAWESSGPRRCGITALGAGGTNCHVILEEAPPPLEGEGARSRQLLVLSAKTRSALDQASERLAHALEQRVDLADAAYTLALGRRAFEHRRFVVARDRAEAIARLRAADAKHSATERPSVVFMFPGGGAQYARMGSELYESERVYRAALEDCFRLIEPALSQRLRERMLAPPAQAEQATRELERPTLTIPSLFITEYALAKLLMSWGVTPSAMVGHSMGEYVAACLAGVMSLRDAMRLVLLRGRLFEAVPAGAMLSAPLSEPALRAWMTPDLSIAAVNGPELSVASGPIASIEALQAALTAREIETTRVRISVAAHSAMLDPILDEFRQLCRSIELRAPTIPFASNVTGRWITAHEATSAEYWVQHLRGTVRFGDCLDTVLAGGERVLLEVGPGRTLCMLARGQSKPAKHIYNSMRHPQEAASDVEYALTTLGRVWASGVELDWSAFYDGQLRNRVPLPSYPFEGQSFWVEPGRGRERAGSPLAKRADVSQWFYGLSWMQQPLLGGASRPTHKRWLIVAHDRPRAHALARALEAADAGACVVITPGEALLQESPSAWWLDFRSHAQVSQLFQALDDRGERFDHVVYLTGSARWLPGFSKLKELELSQSFSQNFYALTYVARSLATVSEPLQLSIVTSQLADVGGESIDPRRALALGPSFVTPHELPLVRTRCIDISARHASLSERAELEQQLIAELCAESSERFTALRPRQRWVQRIVPLAVPKLASHERAWLRDGGVYLITGGLGGIGLEFAKHLASHARVKLALLARSALPPESTWDAILSSADASNLRAQRISAVRELRALGAEVQLVVADVSDAERMRSVLASVRAQLGPLNGVIHAAGLLDDQPMQLKTPAALRSVLAPKVQGTLVLDRLIREQLDFFVLFSSVASVLGLPGQVDYTAASAFMDAFAKRRASRARRGGRTVVVNWNAWRGVGMAEAAFRGQARGLDALTPSAHPALDGYSDHPNGRVFTTNFASDRHWLLSEHRIKDSFALLPGTAFVELARAAFSEGRAAAPIELTNLTFLSPFQVAVGETRGLRIFLTASGGSYHVSMQSGTDFASAPHVVGEARNYIGPAPGKLDLPAIARRCNVREEAPLGGFLAQDFVEFGGRWANIRRMRYGASEALLELELPRAYRADVQGYGLHPALLDMATGGAQALIPGVDLQQDFYVPLSYERIVVFADMPAHVFSHVRCLPESGNGLAFFDVTLSTAEGEVFAELSRFAMKRLDADSAMTAPASVTPSPADTRRSEAMAALLREAILPREGLEAFDRIMAQPNLGQAFVSSVDLIAWQTQLDAVALEHLAGAAETKPAGFLRPELASAFEAPTEPVELALAEVWSELLGVSELGVHDDFFELGGNSLVAVRLFAAIKKRFRVSLPLSALFEAPTIRQLAAVIGNSPLADVSASATPERRLSSEPPRSNAPIALELPGKYTPLVSIQQGTGRPFFCVHGAGGNVLNFQALAKRLGEDQTFYGLQAKGVEGGDTARSIEEMAAAYIDSIRRVQRHGPYLLGGYSGGGVVAYEMAQRLRAAGEEVILAFLDTFHPATKESAPTLQERFEHLLAEGPSYLARTGRQRLKRLSYAANYELRTRYYQKRGMLLPVELRDPHVSIAFERAAAAYVPKRYDGPVMLFRARTIDPKFAHIGPTLGWGELIPKLEIIEVPGDHHSLMVEPNVQFLISHLKALIATAARPSEPNYSAEKVPRRTDVRL